MAVAFQCCLAEAFALVGHRRPPGIAVEVAAGCHIDDSVEAVLVRRCTAVAVVC